VDCEDFLHNLSAAWLADALFELDFAIILECCVVIEEHCSVGCFESLDLFDHLACSLKAGLQIPALV
jgi:hypothetical protein